MNLSFLADENLKVDIRPTVRQAGVKRSSGLATRFANFVGFKRTFNHIGDRAILPSREAMSQIAGLGASYGELWFGHFATHFPEYSLGIRCHQDGRSRQGSHSVFERPSSATMLRLHHSQAPRLAATDHQHRVGWARKVLGGADGRWNLMP
jgi:hypothetical protein